MTGNRIWFFLSRAPRRDDRRDHLTDRRPFRTRRVASIDARA